MNAEKKTLRESLSEWMEKVLAACESGGAIDTYSMIVDVDMIVAKAFDHEPVIAE